LIRVSVRGQRQLTQLARRLKEHGDKSLRSELYRAINRSTKPLKLAVRKSARNRLPRAGGLNRRVEKSKIVTKRRMTGKNAGVRIVGTSGYDIGSINRGRVRHLTWGHLPWHDQAVNPGFWSEPLSAGAPAVRRELREAMDGIAKKIERG
jgi:hypothetical protein